MRKKTHTKLSVFKLTQLILLLIFLFSVSHIIIAQAKVLKVKSENNKLTKQITEMKTTNEKLTQDNKTLLSSIEDKKNVYQEKLSNVKIAYLTFDDGPSKNTLDILATLKKYDVKATFFVNGHPSMKSLYTKIANDGHALANHTYSHDYKYVYASPENFKADIKKLDKFLTEVTGQEPTHIIRYPGGSNNTVSRKYGGRNIMKEVIKTMDKEGYTYFDWNVDSTDASTYCQVESKIVDSVLRESDSAKDGKAVILMHDLGPKVTTVQALPEIIEGLKQRGFIFDVLSNNVPKVQFTKIENLK